MYSHRSTPTTPSLARILVAVAATIAMIAALTLPANARAASSQASSVATPDGLLKWISEHPANAGLAVLPDRGRGISHGAARRYPLASVRKVLIAGRLTSSGADLSDRVPRASVERFYVPGTDGDAHEQAELHPTRPTLRQLLRASLEVSDNATADALLQRVGAPAVDAWARRQGMTRQDPIYPVLGEIAAWTRVADWTERSPADRGRLARALAREVRPSEIKPPDVARQRELATGSVAGTPAQWARLMRHIGRDGDPELVTALDWPRRQSDLVARRFDRFLIKGGALPGVVTQASYLRPAGKPGMAVALFLRDLPADVEQSLAKTFAQQDLIARLATDRAFLDRARRVLG